MEQAKKDRINQLYDKYFYDVYHFLLGFTNNKEEAQDLTQDTFMKIIHKAASFKGTASEKTWILQIAKNTAIDDYRKKKRRNMLKLFEHQEGNYGISFHSPLTVLEKKDEIATLYTMVNKLKPYYRSVLLLRNINELSIKETAKILNCSESKVKVSYHRAMKKLKELYTIHEEEHPNGNFR